MRIISGKHKGMILKGFDIDGTRPTMDRVKESLFGIIQNEIPNSVCLDLFAGSGSLGIEAISNGASMVYFVDNGKVFDILKANLSKVTDYQLMKNDYKDALVYFKENGIKFNVIFLDPPYHKHLINNCLKYIIDNDLLFEKGQVVCEYTDEIIICDYELIKEKKYGDKFIKIFKKPD